MPNNIAAIRNYTTILDRVCQREAKSSCLNSPARMARAGSNAKEIMIPKISVSSLGNYKRNVRGSCQCGLPAKMSFSITAA
ncbi:MAG: hypothetical protein LKJ98_00455 [Olsenella sp.]|jgi:hypothetical protein|nr:hypothetical protein [Olsenella sp.]